MTEQTQSDSTNITARNQSLCDKLPPLWSDDLDMDLLWPDFPARLGSTVAIPVWTVGHTSEGRLPPVWNTHGAYLWLEKPSLQRDKGGWFRVQGCISDAEEVECTWLEWLRDWRPHHYGFLLEGHFFEAANGAHFEAIMADVRGWKQYGNAQTAYRSTGILCQGLRNSIPYVDEGVCRPGEHIDLNGCR
jgi:hypothetical protein